MKKAVAIFCIGAAAYPLLEIVWRGFSHWSMAAAGGFSLCALARVEQRGRRRTLRQKCMLGALIITAIEFVCGCVCNKWLKLNVWDYSHLPGNLWGQVCLPFTAIWFLLCIPVFAVLQRAFVSRRA